MEHKGSWELLRQIGQGFVERGERRLQQDDAAAAWNDLLRAEQIGVTDKSAKLRQAFTWDMSSLSGSVEPTLPPTLEKSPSRLRPLGLQRAAMR